MLVFDSNRRPSLTSLTTRWLKEMRDHTSSDSIRGVVVANKWDLESEGKQETWEEAKRVAEEVRMRDAGIYVSRNAFTLTHCFAPLTADGLPHHDCLGHDRRGCP